MKDALGNEMVVGQLYGYSQPSNGFTMVRTGKLSKIGESLVTLDIEFSGIAVYSNDIKPEVMHKKKINVKSNGLFPIYPGVRVVESWSSIVEDRECFHSMKDMFPNGVIIRKEQ
jgi:hypothetical protein